MLAAIRAVQTFDEVFVLTGGGPGSATTFVVQFLYQTGFVRSRCGCTAWRRPARCCWRMALVVLTLIQLLRRPRQRRR